MKKTIDQRLKSFIEEYIPVETLQKSGFFPKGMRKDNYEVIAQRVCHFFGFKTIYEYWPTNWTEHAEANCISGKFPDKVGSDGKLISGDCFHLDICQSEFICPICECPQEIPDNGKTSFTHKCKGCKGPLNVFADHLGNLTVSEKK